VGSWTATNIHNAAARGQEPLEDVPGPQPDQVAQARLPQTIVLINQLILGRHPTVDLHAAQYGKPAHAWRSVFLPPASTCLPLRSYRDLPQIRWQIKASGPASQSEASQLTS
jgi:hypothetical protein